MVRCRRSSVHRFDPLLEPGRQGDADRCANAGFDRKPAMKLKKRKTDTVIVRMGWTEM
jgi:hypothetical protein